MYLTDGERSVLRQTEEYKKTKEIINRLSLIIERRWDYANVYPPPWLPLEEMLPKVLDKLKESREISSILRGEKSRTDYGNDRLKSLSKTFEYLALVESLGVSFADLVLMLAIALGSHLHTRGGYTKHVSSFEELEELTLYHKLDFLVKELGLSIFNIMINRETRNIIAHLEFKIESDGKILRRNGKQIPIDNEICNFWKGVDILELVFEDLRLWVRLEQLAQEKRKLKQSDRKKRED
jgi:hypothetical protein